VTVTLTVLALVATLLRCYGTVKQNHGAIFIGLTPNDDVHAPF